MRYSCNCPEWAEKPCDNPNEDIECEDCQYSKPDDERD